MYGLCLYCLLFNPFPDGLFERGYLTYVRLYVTYAINSPHYQNVLHGNQETKLKFVNINFQTSENLLKNRVMKYCLIFYFYLAIATKNYTTHHKAGYSLDVDDDFSKIAVIFQTCFL